MEAFTVAPVKPRITIEDFARIDIRVGTIRSVEDVALACSGPAAAPARGSPGCGLDRSPGPSLRSRSRSARLLPSGRLLALRPGGVEDDIGYADGITPVLAVPEKPVPDGTRAG